MRRLAPLALLTLANTDAVVPQPVLAMLEAAMAGDNEADVATIVRYARAADPASGDEVAAIAAAWRDARARATRTRIEHASPLELWTGRAEVGGTISTGNSDTFGASALLDVKREGLEWRHKLRLQADYAESLGIQTREHYLFAYEPNLKLDDRRYVYGAAQFESDRFLGYDRRYSVSLGAGLNAIRQQDLRLALELGPGYRDTRFTDGRLESSVAARGSLDLKWQLAPGMLFTQTASTYVQRFNSTVSSNSSLAARVFGPLSASVSYQVQYESQPPIGRVSTDTFGRAGLTYTF